MCLRTSYTLRHDRPLIPGLAGISVRYMKLWAKCSISSPIVTLPQCISDSRKWHWLGVQRFPTLYPSYILRNFPFVTDLHIHGVPSRNPRDSAQVKRSSEVYVWGWWEWIWTPYLAEEGVMTDWLLSQLQGKKILNRNHIITGFLIFLSIGIYLYSECLKKKERKNDLIWLHFSKHCARLRCLARQQNGEKHTSLLELHPLSWSEDQILVLK